MGLYEEHTLKVYSHIYIAGVQWSRQVGGAGRAFWQPHRTAPCLGAARKASREHMICGSIIPSVRWMFRALAALHVAVCRSWSKNKSIILLENLNQNCYITRHRYSIYQFWYKFILQIFISLSHNCYQVIYQFWYKFSSMIMVFFFS